MLRKQVRHLLPGMALCSFMLLLGVGVLPAYGEFLKYTYPPGVLHVDLDKNIIVVLSGENPECVIQRLDTGERVWSMPGQDGEVDFGNDAVVITRKGSIQVLDKATGRELWSESGEHLNFLGRPYFIGDSQWVKADCNESVIWYTPEGKHLKPVIPDVPEKKIGVAGWMEDGQTLLLTVYEETEDGVNTLTVYFWKPEDNHLEKGYVLKSSLRLSVWITPFDKKAIYAEYDAIHSDIIFAE